jgi:large subunit ribosomal protein L6
MSHIGKQPVKLLEGVKIVQTEEVITVSGPKGELKFNVHPAVEVKLEEDKILVSQRKKFRMKKRDKQALWGTTRAQLANMVQGVTEGFAKKLELHGVGYRAALKGNGLNLSLGFSHPVEVAAPEGITFEVNAEQITVKGIDVQQVGEIAATIRKLRPPEPYKGKGIRYMGEKIQRKVGKVVGSTG